MDPRLAVIIPAYNEEPTVGAVIAAAHRSPLVSEVIVVSDGSTDATAEVARAAGADVVVLVANKGKGEALRAGVARTNAPLLLFLDADVYGLTPEHVERLVLPVLSGSRVMNVGLRDRGRFITNLTRFLPLISGERAMRREVFEGVPREYAQGFMVEAALNYFCRSRRLDYGHVILPGVTIRRKIAKVGWRRGMVQYVLMGAAIVKSVLFVRVARLIGRF
jgi:glycosyltransferase involved in cell wall biosynthesis